MAGYTIPSYSLYGNRVVCYELPVTQYVHRSGGNTQVRASKSFTLSQGQAKRIRTLVDCFVDCAMIAYPTLTSSKAYPLNFITLTLPSKQIHCDCTITRECLRSFIQALEYKSRVNYLWVAERQKNGNIHYHMLVDRYYPHQEIRRLWNQSVNRLGYVDRYQEQMAWRYRDGFFIDRVSSLPVADQFKRYMYGARTNWRSPNSTDIKKRPERVLRRYIAKYLTKEDNIFCGKLYGANNAVRNLRPFHGVVPIKLDTFIATNPEKVIRLEQCVILVGNWLNIAIMNYPEIAGYYQQQLTMLGYN